MGVGAMLLPDLSAYASPIDPLQALDKIDVKIKKELADVGVQMVLYPLSAFRAMNKAALNVYQHLLDDGDQKAVIDSMQTRMELYDFLNYHSYEQKLDALFADNKNK